MSQQINLFNPIFLKQKKVFTSIAMVQALGLVLVGAVLVAFYASRNIAALKAEMEAGKILLNQRTVRLAEASEQFAPRQKNAALEADLAAAEVQLKGMRDVAGILKRGEFGNTRGYAEYFRAFARQRVNGLWLTGLSIHGAGVDIGVKGRALEPAMVPNYIGRLGQETVLRGKTFASLQIGQPSKEAVAPFVEFSLQTNLEQVK
ncbi:MAG: hypothetical protein V4463_02950 [Pseudomonadota bacterium]